MADLFWPSGFQFFDDSGNPLNAGTIAFYDATTTNPRTLYQDSTQATPWGTGLTLNSAGRLTASVYFPTGAWKYVLKNSAAVTIATVDNIPGAVATSDASFAQPTLPILTKAGNYTVVIGDLGKKINVDATGGDITITLLSAITAGDGAYLVVQNVGATGTVAVAAFGAETINGASTLVLRAKDDSVDLTGDAANWTGAVSSEIRTTLSKTADYTVTRADFNRLIKVDATAGAVVISLPVAATAGSGFGVSVQKIDASANTVTIDGNASETINGATTRVLAAQWDGGRLACDGSNWELFGTPLAATATASGVIEIATNAEAIAKTDTTRAVVPSNLAALGASDTFAGFAEIAIQSEMETATDVVRYVTPGRVKFHPGVAKCWAYVTGGGTPVITDSYNITSITDTGTGRLTITIATDFSSADWSPSVTLNPAAGVAHCPSFLSIAAGTIELQSREGTTNNLADPTAWSFQGFGDQA